MSGPLHGKRVALVGNGPSSADQGQLIDACDFVVRQSRWLGQGAARTGSKLSALCGFNANTEVPDWLRERRDWELWTNMSAACFRPEPCKQDPGDWKWLFATADGRPIRLPRNQVLEEAAAHLRSVSKYRVSLPYLDMGTVLVAMIIDLGASYLELWGYDRTGIGKPNDHWGQQQYTNAWDQTHHDYRARTVMLGELVDRGTWCGRPVNCRTFWHGRPELPPVGPEPVWDAEKKVVYHVDPTTGDRLEPGT